MSPVRLEARKPNGTLHQSWQAELLAEHGDWIIIHSPYGTSVRHHTKNLDYVMAHSNLGIFNTKAYYNVFIDFHKDGRFKMLYVNIATPAQLQANTISWTDLYLDIVRMAGKQAELVDQDEFEEAKAKGWLDDKLANKAGTVAATLMQIVDKAQFPFLVSDREETRAMVMSFLGGQA